MTRFCRFGIRHLFLVVTVSGIASGVACVFREAWRQQQQAAHITVFGELTIEPRPWWLPAALDMWYLQSASRFINFHSAGDEPDSRYKRQGARAIDVGQLRELTSLRDLTLIRFDDDFSSLLRFPHLRRLEIRYGSTSDISPLADLTQLRELKIVKLPIRDLSPIERLKYLDSLTIDLDTESTDISPIWRLRHLRRLAISSSHIRAVGPIANPTLLESLQLLDLPLLSDVSEIGRLTALRDLALIFTGVEDITCLKPLQELRGVDLRHSHVRDIKVLSMLPNLEKIVLASTPVNDITPLRNLRKLRELELADSSVTDISALEDLGNIEWVGLSQVACTKESVDRLRRAKPQCVLSSRYILPKAPESGWGFYQLRAGGPAQNFSVMAEKF